MSDGDDDDETPLRCAVEDLTWVAPKLTGVFDREIRVPPQLVIDGEPVVEVAWEMGEPSAGKTRFAVTLGEKPAAALSQVAAVCFVFETGEESLPTFPYHPNVLMALASGQRRTDLLKQAGDFELDDEELEELLAQLDQALVVDGRSIWRMLKRKVPDQSADETSASIAYDDLDWDAIQSHPKLAQYRNWDQHSSSNPTALGMLLTSIAKRFEATVQRRHEGGPEPDGPDSPSDPLDDLAKVIDAEDEEGAEKDELTRDRRRTSARSRVRRQFHSFVQRFVDGLTDEAFVRHVGPSVLVPSYVIFNHLCWKLIQIDLADPLRLTRLQTTLWRFFWGDKSEPGYFATLRHRVNRKPHSTFSTTTTPRQSSSARYSKPTKHTQHEKDHRAMIEVRDAWRTIVLQPLFQPTETAVDQAATPDPTRVQIGVPTHQGAGPPCGPCS